MVQFDFVVACARMVTDPKAWNAVAEVFSLTLVFVEECI